MLFFFSLVVCSPFSVEITMMFRVIQFVCLMICCQFACSQAVDTISYPYKIHGVIYDEIGNPMPGVNIVSPGDGNRQVSNIRGEYYAHIYSSQTAVVFTYPKFENVQFCPDGRLVVDIVLVPTKGWWFKKTTGRISSLFRSKKSKMPICN